MRAALTRGAELEAAGTDFKWDSIDEKDERGYSARRFAVSAVPVPTVLPARPAPPPKRKGPTGMQPAAKRR